MEIVSNDEPNKIIYPVAIKSVPEVWQMVDRMFVLETRT